MGGVAPVVFLSHTPDLGCFPEARSFVAATRDAARDARCRVAGVAGPAGPGSTAAARRRQVESCDVYVGLIGQAYGPPVVDLASQSYLELEYEAAGAAGLDRLVFLLHPATMIPGAAHLDPMLHRHQAVFRERLRSNGLRGWFSTDEQLYRLSKSALEGWRTTWPKRPTKRRQPARPGAMTGLADLGDWADWL